MQLDKTHNNTKEINTNNNMETDVSTLTVIELKAIAFDLIKQIQFNQNQLSIIEQELIRRAQLPKENDDSV